MIKTVPQLSLIQLCDLFSVSCFAWVHPDVQIISTRVSLGGFLFAHFCSPLRNSEQLIYNECKSVAVQVVIILLNKIHARTRKSNPPPHPTPPPGQESVKVGWRGTKRHHQRILLQSLTSANDACADPAPPFDKHLWYHVTLLEHAIKTTQPFLSSPHLTPPSPTHPTHFSPPLASTHSPP